MTKININNINKLKLEAIQKTTGKSIDEVITILTMTYIKTLTEEDAKKLIEAI